MSSALIEAQKSNRKAALFWGAVIIGLLGSQIAVGVVSVVLATSDPSFAVVPDYHEKALKWDDAIAAQQASNKLGWKTAFTVSPAADQLGQRTVVLNLVDAKDQAIMDAKVSVRAYHHARANEVVEQVLRHVDAGHYVAALPMQRNGLWQVELTAQRGDERFESTQTINTLAQKQ